GVPPGQLVERRHLHVRPRMAALRLNHVRMARRRGPRGVPAHVSGGPGRPEANHVTAPYLPVAATTGDTGAATVSCFGGGRWGSFRERHEFTRPEAPVDARPRS